MSLFRSAATISSFTLPKLAHAGLAIGLGTCINALFLLLILKRRGICQPEPGWGKFFLRMAPAAIALIALMLTVDHYIDWIGLHSQATRKSVFYAFSARFWHVPSSILGACCCSAFAPPTSAAGMHPC
jgi:peptidoglycan biosynthesis protein MviN/MurJ (putative lipid II flippase)